MKYIEEMAQKKFKNHVIKRVATIPCPEGVNFGIWECGEQYENKTFKSQYKFTIIHAPNLLWCGGDVGDCEWRRTYNMIAWARGAINDEHYFFEKVPNHIKKEEFNTDQATKFIEDIRKDKGDDEDDSKYQKLLESCGDKDSFYSEWSEQDIWQGDYPSTSEVYDYTPNLYWARECVRWFLNNVK